MPSARSWRRALCPSTAQGGQSPTEPGLLLAAAQHSMEPLPLGCFRFQRASQILVRNPDAVFVHWLLWAEFSKVIKYYFY